MKTNLRRLSMKQTRRGLTLVEVVASIALLSTLLVMLLTAHSRHVRQIAVAHERQMALRHLDSLLGEWFQMKAPFPRNQQGLFQGSENLSWRTSTQLSKVSNQKWLSETVRVDVLNAKQEIVTSIELLDSVVERELAEEAIVQ